MTLSLADAAATAGERVALVSAERTLTYRELAQRVALAQGWLSAQGIAPSAPEPVALVMSNHLAAIELFWALFALSRPVLVLHPKQRPEVRAELVTRTGAVEVDAASWAAAANWRATPVSASPSPPAGLIVPTSGTLGQPKLVALSERALLASANANWQNLGVLDDERWLACLPLGHVGGLSVLTRSLAARRTAVLFDGDGLLARLDELARTLEQQQVTLVSLVPTVLDALLEHGFRAPPRLRAVLLGGAAATPSVLERARRAGVPLLTSYGLTEAASQVTTRRYDLRHDEPELGGGLVGSGHPLAGVELRLSSDGDIEIAGPTLFSGYWGEPPALGADGWFRTGDRGAFSQNGELLVLGRRDDLILTGGENVDPLAVEAVLSRLEGLRGVGVFGAPDPRWGQVVAAALSFDPRHRPNLSDLEVFCSAMLSPHERPRLVALLPDLPLNANGKLD